MNRNIVTYWSLSSASIPAYVPSRAPDRDRQTNFGLATPRWSAASQSPKCSIPLFFAVPEGSLKKKHAGSKSVGFCTSDALRNYRDTIWSDRTSTANATAETLSISRVTRGRTRKDKNLISRADENPFVKNPDCERAEQIWRELQFHLEFDLHDNAIAVLMRVLLDIAITHYAREQGITLSHTDAFAKRVSAVADSMLNRGFIDTKGRSIVRKFESDKPIVSAHSMHQYVHNPNFHPAKSDLKAIWNVIRPLIVNATK